MGSPLITGKPPGCLCRAGLHWSEAEEGAWCWASLVLGFPGAGSLLPCAERAGAAGELGQRAGSRTRSRFSVRRHAPGPSLIGKVSSERLQLFKLI